VSADVKSVAPKLVDETEESSTGDASNLVLLQYLRKYWITAVATAVIVVTIAVFFTLGQKRIFEAHTTVMFDPSPPQPLGSSVETVMDMGADNYWSNQEYYETQYHIITSRRVALAVVAELGLHHDPGFLGNLPEGDTEEQAQSAPPEVAAETLRSRLEVTPIKDSRLASVKYRDASPMRAQRVLAAVVETYTKQNLDNALASTSTATDWLHSQLDTLKGDLESAELDLHKYKKSNNILSVAFDDKSNMLRTEMSEISTELTRVRASLVEAQARSAVLSTVDESDPTNIASSELLRSGLLASLREEYERAKRDRAALMGAGRGANHPEVAAATQRVEAAKAAVLKEIGNIKRAVGRDVAVLQRQAGGLSAMFDTAKNQAHDLNLLEIEYNRLRRSKENTEKLYSLLLERTKEGDLTQMLRVNNISVVDEPLVPSYPVSPNVPMNLAFGVFLGVMLGIGTASLRGLFDRTLKAPEDVRQELQATFLGLLPQFGKQSADYYGKRRHRGRRLEAGAPELVVHHDPTSGVAEAARAIRTNLMFMDPDSPAKTLLVTSAGPSEGKTTVATCIAIAMAQAGQRVLLIDCDLRRPRIRRVFGISGDNGVTSALLDDTFTEAVQDTTVPNLRVMGSGPVPPNPAELFHTDRFKRLLERARSRFDRVIVDSPPVAAVTDATILSTLVDGTVLVVRAGKTRKDVGRYALRSLQGVGGKVAGVVLNAMDFSRSSYLYSQYYYYGTSSYAPDSPDRGDAVAEDRDHLSA
jgi:polysaccharide biosynthesis transport protein